MNGSVRQPNSGADSPRAPYAAPQSPAAALSVADSGTASAHTLRPFIPPGFRDFSLHGGGPRPSVVVEAGGNARSEPTETSDVSVSASNDLPWIEAFAAESPVPERGTDAVVSQNDASFAEGDVEDSWMLGEAGRRLEELTQSLSSLDALRSPDAESADPVAGPEALGAWSDDEWIDIMPAASTASADELRDLELAGRASDADASGVHGRRTADVGGTREAAARALEAVAARVRSGDLSMPTLGGEQGGAPHPGDAALLAAVLAALLGFRRA
jgi:hypothetical protein